MATVSTSEFRKGIKVEIEGQPYLMAEVEFVKPGKGQGIYRTKLRNLLNGSLLDRTYKSGDSLPGADVREGNATYLYKDRTGYVFMDADTFEQHTIREDQIGDAARFLKEEMECRIMYWNDTPISAAAPNHVNLKITYTEPAARGDTVGNVLKPATVETGAEVFVPAFVQTGQTIRIDTRTGEYIERVNA